MADKENSQIILPPLPIGPIPTDTYIVENGYGYYLNTSDGETKPGTRIVANKSLHDHPETQVWEVNTRGEYVILKLHIDSHQNICVDTGNANAVVLSSFNCLWRLERYEDKDKGEVGTADDLGYWRIMPFPSIDGKVLGSIGDGTRPVSLVPRREGSLSDQSKRDLVRKQLWKFTPIAF